MLVALEGVRFCGFVKNFLRGQPERSEGPACLLARRGEDIMAERMIKCVKFQRELPGLDEPPFGNDLGKRIYENVSQDAWKLWIEHLKMIVNEYRLNLVDREAQRIVQQQMEEYFFGEGAALPPGYVPPQTKQ